MKKYKEKFHVCNKCQKSNCVYNLKSRCYCYKKLRKTNKKGDCISYLDKNSFIKNPVSELIEEDSMVVPGYLLSGRNDRNGNQYEVHFEKYYLNRCLVSFEVNNHVFRSNIFNIDLINLELKRRKKEWEKETEILNKLIDNTKFKLI